MKTISEIIGGAQILLPLEYELQDCFPELLNYEHRSFLHHLRVIEGHLPQGAFIHGQKTGRPYGGDRKYFRAFLAKAFFGLESTKNLISRLHADMNLRYLCGFESNRGLSEATFSTRFALLAKSELANKVHKVIVVETLKDELVGHVSRDSTAIETRERPVNRKKDTEMQEKPRKKRGRPKKGEEQPKKLTEIEKQVNRSSEESLAALNKEAAWGGKKNSSGKTHYWKGGKLHLDVTDNGLPVTALYTGADVHDSQLAIPMEQITSSRIKYCYTVMDSAYNSCVIEEFIKSQGHVPIIDPKKLKGEVKIPLDPAKKERYKIRSSVERGQLPSEGFVSSQAALRQRA